MFSVIIPLYNKARSVRRTVISVLSQDFTDFELIIVDDGSTDDSVSQISTLHDERITILKKINGGVSSARNHGARAANRDFIAFIDADDIWLPHHLTTLKALIGFYGESSDIFAATTSVVKNDDGVRQSKNISGDVDGFLISDYFKAASAPRGLLSSSSFAIRRTAFSSIGGYDEKYSYGEDVEFWYRFFKRKSAALAFSPMPTVEYRVDAENRSGHRHTSLQRRFSEYDFTKANGSERGYLGKLVFLLLIDYALSGHVADVMRVFWKYLPYHFYAMRYGMRLLVKKLHS